VEEQIAEGFKRITQAVSGQEAPLLGEGEGLVIESHTSSEGVDEQVAYVDVDGVRIRVYQRHDRNTGELITEFGYVSASGDSVTASRSETLGRGSLGVEEEVNPRFETVPLVVPPPPGPVAAPSPPRSAAAEEGGGLTKLLVGESAVDFFVDALVGEYSQDASLGSIALDTGITLIPVVDQVGDARDLSAHLYYLIVNGEYDQAMRWVGLVLTAVGAIPEVGTAIKGTLRLLLRAAKGVAENAGEIVRLLRRLMPDFADDLPAMVRWIRNNWPAWRAAAREIAVRSIDNATLLASRVSDNAARVRRIAGQKIDEALDLAWAQVNEALDRLAREFGVDDLQFGPRLAPAGGPPMPPTRLPEGPRQLEPMQMSGSRDLDEIMGEPQSLDETLEHLGRTANPTGRGEVGSRRVDAYEPRIENPAETALMKAQAHEAFQKFVDDGFMPPGTQVRSVRVQRTTAGRAQQAATSRRGLAQTPEFEPHFTLLSGRSFQPDDIIPEGASGYRFGDHKTLLNRDRSFYLTEKGEQALRTRFQRDLEVFEETSASGCRGWLYTTDDLALYEVIERLVIEMDGGRGILSVAAR
jgi:hypothetical protein